MLTQFFGQSIVSLAGAAYRIAPDAAPESLAMAMKHADGHSPDLEKLSGSQIVHKPHMYITVATYLILLALPGWYFR